MRPRTFSIQTLGCKVNQYEGEQLAALLRARGLTPAPADEADLRVVHTCSVTVQAASKSRQLARRTVGGDDRSPTTRAAPPASRRPVSLPVLAATADTTAEACLTAETPSPNGPVVSPHGGASIAGPPRVLVTGCWATSDPAAAQAMPGVTAVITHHDDVAAELDRLLQSWHCGGTEHGKENQGDPIDPRATRAAAHAGPQTSDRPTPGQPTPGRPSPGQPSLRQPPLQAGTDAGHKSDAVPPSRKASPEPSPHDGWNESAGTPAHGLTPLSKSPQEDGVNGKISAGSTSDKHDGRPPTDTPRPQEPTVGGRPVGGRSTEVRTVGFASLPLADGRQAGRRRALLKVQDGCDAHCTYCIIPRLRPALWSKPIGDAVEEARRLVDEGHVELVLTGIFLGAYGHETALRRRQGAAGIAGVRMMDEGGRMKEEQEEDGGARPPSSFIPPPSSLASLVDALCTRVPGLRRVRLSSLEPGDLTGDLLATLRSHPQVVPHFHLPLQSGSDRLLRRMNRQYTRDDFLRMVDQVRSAFDRPALTTDVIAGFPGEGDAEFARTAEVAEAAGFIHVHAFHFSPRPGTAAARWQRDFVRGPVVNERIEALRAIADRHSLAFRQSFVGQTVELLVERERDDGGAGTGAAAADHPTLRHGRCERYFPVWFDDPAVQPGDFVRVRVTDVTPARTHGVRM